MNNKIIDVLMEIQEQYGDMVFYSHQKTKNLLHDFAPGLHKERIHISQFLEINGYFQLKYSGHSYPLIRARLAQNYIETFGVSDSVAIWVLDVFSEVLGYSDFKNLENILQTEPQIEEIPHFAPKEEREKPFEKPVETAAEAKEEPPKESKKPPTPSTPSIEVIEAKPEENIILPTAPPLSPKLDMKTRIAADMHSVAVMPDGTVRAVGPNHDGECRVGHWQGIKAVAAGPHFTVALREDGTVVACGRNEFGQCNVYRWRDIIQISAGARHTVGLRADGTLVATGQNSHGECNVYLWQNIVRISAGYLSTFAIKKDRTVLVKGDIKGANLSAGHLSGVEDIVNPYNYRSLVLKRNGRLDILGENESFKKSVSKWRDLAQISAGPDYFAGLFKDGTVRILAYYWTPNGIECNAYDWEDIEAIAAGRFHLLGVKKDGSVKSVLMHPANKMNRGQCRVDDWRLL
ncbi:MAG: hypothetical protein FWG65_03130 [Turicibacter sp.]|nr:hypothetical protein [Turicibacter sp.]